MDDTNQKGRERCDRKKLKTQYVLLTKRVRKTIRISGDFCGEKRAFTRIIGFYFELFFQVDAYKQKKKRFYAFDTERR